LQLFYKHFETVYLHVTDGFIYYTQHPQNNNILIGI